MIAHSHCPDGCDHPQPFRTNVTPALAELFYLDPSVVYEFCGRCSALFGELVPMVPCAPPYCEDE